MKCKACDGTAVDGIRTVKDELGNIHVMLEDLCRWCILQSKYRYSDDDLRDIYQGVQHGTFKVIR